MHFRRLIAIEQLEERKLLTGGFRSIDGSGNNPIHPDWGQTDSQLVRLTSVEYEDGVAEPAGGLSGTGRPNPREISNAILDQQENVPNDRELTNFVFQWGQFVDHDLSLTETADPVEEFDIAVPYNDPTFVPGSQIGVSRSNYDPSTGTGLRNPRQQINQITAFIDASNVYGSDEVRADALRTRFGGQLKTSDGNMLPYNVDRLPNASPAPLAKEEYYLAGDVRANEHPGLTAMHTIFVREHNRLAAELAASEEFRGQDLANEAVDEHIYQRARQIVGAQMQAITYNEFLPALLGPSGVSSSGWYRSNVNPGIANIFSGALYRVGHTMLPENLEVYNSDGTPMGTGAVSLVEAFFNPIMISGNETSAGYGIEPFLMGLSKQQLQEIDALMVDSMREMQMGPGMQFDLAAINMQRGREHGLPDYNQTRLDFEMSPARSFKDITSDPTLAGKLSSAYDGNLMNIDVWLGGIAEDHIAGGSVGELVHTVLVDQFERLRDGDRFYYERALPRDLVNEINETRLSDIIHRNTSLNSLQAEVFRDPNVFVVRAPSDLASQLTIETSRGFLRVIDSRTGAQLASRPLEEISGVVVFGSSKNDHIVFRDSIRQFGGLIEVHGGAGYDRLEVDSAWSIRRKSGLFVDRTQIVFGNVEQVLLGDRFDDGGIRRGKPSPMPWSGRAGLGNTNDQSGHPVKDARFVEMITGTGLDGQLEAEAASDNVFSAWGDRIARYGEMGDGQELAGRIDLDLQGSLPQDRPSRKWTAN